MLTRLLVITLTIGITSCSSLTPFEKYKQNLSDGNFNTSLTKEEFHGCINENPYLQEGQRFSTLPIPREVPYSNNVYVFNYEYLWDSAFGTGVTRYVSFSFAYQRNLVNLYIAGTNDKWRESLLSHYRTMCS